MWPLPHPNGRSRSAPTITDRTAMVEGVGRAPPLLEGWGATLVSFKGFDRILSSYRLFELHFFCTSFINPYFSKSPKIYEYFDHPLQRMIKVMNNSVFINNLNKPSNWFSIDTLLYKFAQVSHRIMWEPLPRSFSSIGPFLYRLSTFGTYGISFEICIIL